MKVQKFLIFILFLFAFGESENSVKIKSAYFKPLVSLEVISSSADNIENLFNTNIWYSTVYPNKELLLFKFSSPVYLKKISVLTDDKKIKTLEVFAKNKSLKTSSLSAFDLEAKTDFLIFKFNTDDLLTYVIDDSLTSYWLSLADFTSAFGIKKIIFYDNQNQPIKFILVRNVKKNEKIYDFEKRNFVCKCNKALKSFSFNPNGYFTIFYKDKLQEKFIFGKWKKGIDTKAYLPIFIEGMQYEYKRGKFLRRFVSGKLKLCCNYIETDTLAGRLVAFPLDLGFFVLLRSYDSTFVYDIRYATKNNFAKKKFYPCAECFLQYLAAIDLVKANREFMKNGYKIKLFDCYRPFSVQKKMWEIVRNINYVAPPNKGSSHNRGVAVDLTLTDSLGNEVDMGTEYDSFTPKASPNYADLPQDVLRNRRFLDSILRKHNFRPIKTEWWHFYHISIKAQSIYDYPLPCEQIKADAEVF